MRHIKDSSTRSTQASWRAIGALAALLMVAGSLCILFAADATAATLNGVATIAVAADPSQALPSGGSTTQFTVTLPANAACSGDTASDGYHVYSYLIPEGTDLSTVKFVGSPSTGFGFVNTLGVYYGAANTAVTTGQIVSIPADFEWGPLVSIDKVPLASLLYTGGTSGAWEAGIACANTNGALSDNWNTPITFTASDERSQRLHLVGVRTGGDATDHNDNDHYGSHHRIHHPDEHHDRIHPGQHRVESHVDDGRSRWIHDGRNTIGRDGW